jgi:cytochrome c peroxidase
MQSKTNRTAPYFHDNSAKTLEEVAQFYALFFRDSPATRGFVFTEQDQADMVAFLKLLR